MEFIWDDEWRSCRAVGTYSTYTIALLEDWTVTHQLPLEDLKFDTLEDAKYACDLLERTLDKVNKLGSLWELQQLKAKVEAWEEWSLVVGDIRNDLDFAFEKIPGRS